MSDQIYRLWWNLSSAEGRSVLSNLVLPFAADRAWACRRVSASRTAAWDVHR